MPVLVEFAFETVGDIKGRRKTERGALYCSNF